MFGFHSRSRSLIPVRDLEKSEVMEKYVEVEEEKVVEEEVNVQQKRQIMMIYLLFLAEAIMASSLSSQITVLMPSAGGCMSTNTNFLRSIFECAYFLGSTAGLFWGWASDRCGRRRIALLGLTGMSVCCFCMGFATDFLAFTSLRFVAGMISSAVSVAGMAMLADATHGSSAKTITVARLPVIAVCGSIGPLASDGIHRLSEANTFGVFAKYPGLSGQIACAGLVFTIMLAEVLVLEETLVSQSNKQPLEEDSADCEKAAFLGQSLSNVSRESLNINIIDALHDDNANSPPSRISIAQMLNAPSVVILLASFSALSLHSSTFDILLPHIGHTASHSGGMGIPCSWLGLITTVVKVLAAVRIMKAVPFIVSKVGLLQMYRKICLVFPLLYTVIPLVGLAVTVADGAAITSAIVSTIAMLVKTTLAGAAQVLVLLLVLSAAPDACSTGTVIGVVSISGLFKALAVGASGISYYLTNEYSILAVNITLWAALTALALIGAFFTWNLRENPRVGTDIPEECLSWQGIFDAEGGEDDDF